MKEVGVIQRFKLLGGCKTSKTQWVAVEELKLCYYIGETL